MQSIYFYMYFEVIEKTLKPKLLFISKSSFLNDDAKPSHSKHVYVFLLLYLCHIQSCLSLAEGEDKIICNNFCFKKIVCSLDKV